MNELILLKALADPTRLEVVRFLSARDRTVGAIVSHVRMEQSLVSHHLKVLREAGLVESRYQGAHVVYRLAHERLGRLVKEVSSTAGALEGSCHCVECGGTLLRPYPTEGAARRAGGAGGGGGG